MVDRTDQDEKLRIAQEYFRSLGIEGWEETNSPVQAGGQATILIVKRSDGVKGAFRFTTEPEEKELDRFGREIRIVSDFDHPNILKILDYSKDKTAPWYISEFGGSFTAYWKKQRELFTNDPERLVRNAKDVLRQLADGLAPLHDRRIVHRDIKPSNIIVKLMGTDPKPPVLIDFGLAHVEAEPRLSDVNETVGNVRFSPDIAMYHMDNVSSWLDVHNLAQLFMWMTRVHPDKDWQRALDWRWVNYDERLRGDSIDSMRALTAQCSEQTIAPKDGRELIQLIDNLFPQIQSSPSALISLSKIEEGRRRGIAASSLALVENTRIVEASFPFAAKTYASLCQALESLFEECRAVGIEVNKISDVALDTLRRQLFETNNVAIDMWLIGWQVGTRGGNAFTIRIGGQAIVPNRRSEWSAGGGRLPPESFNPFFFNLHVFGPSTGGAFPAKGRAILLDNKGSLFLCDTTMGIGEITPISIVSVIEIVKEWIEDPDVWEALHKLK